MKKYITIDNYTPYGLLEKIMAAINREQTVFVIDKRNETVKELYKWGAEEFIRLVFDETARESNEYEVFYVEEIENAE